MMKNGISLGSSKILMTETNMGSEKAKKKKLPYSLIGLLVLFEKTTIVILKGNKIYHRLKLRLYPRI